MKEYGLFDLIGPQMIGPSSSHTAGAARIGYVASRMAGGCVKKAVVTLYGSFAETGKGQRRMEFMRIWAVSAHAL